MSTQGHEKEAVNVEGLKAALKSSGNKAIYNEAICSTAGGTAAKVTNTVPPSFSLVSGAKILVKFTYAITVANATLQVGTNAAKPIFYHGAALAANLVKAGTSLLLTYDGTNFNIVGDINTDTTYSVMGASGANHASGLVPDTPSVAGTTKFLREDGTWQEPEGKNYSAGSGIDITNGEISVDSTVIYTKTQVDGQFIVIVNSNSEPTESTLTYTATDGTTKSFKTGDEVRIPDAEADNGYTFYKLYALTTEGGVTTATWDKLGAGGSATLKETVVISLSQYNGSAADLIGATIVVEDDDTSETLLSTTWQGYDISIDIESNTTYTIIVGSVTGYMTPNTQTYQALPTYTREVEFVYNNSIGVYIEAVDGSLYSSAKWSSSGKNANSIVILSSSHRIRMALTEVSKAIHNSLDSTYANYNAVKDETTAKANFNGTATTANIIQFNTAKGTNTTTYLAPYCASFTFPDGTSGAYVPTLGIMYFLYQNKTNIEACLSACSATPMTQGWYLTSDCRSGGWEWALDWSGGTCNDKPISDATVPCRPCANYS